jgi:DNA polymerase III sliding clamp (beta) subunit (PCNA family)
VIIGRRGRLTIRTNQGTYPNYRHLIPDESQMTTTVIFQSKELVDGIKVATNGTANLRLYPEANAVKLVSREGDVSREYLCPAMVSGEGKIAVNPKFLLDLARLSDSLTLSWNNPTEPIRAQTTRGLHVIMPLFVQWD